MGMEHLDTVLAFSVFMLLLSLVITMAVQAVVALLGLRGKNLLWGIEQILDRSVGTHTKEISEKIISHAMIASPFRGKATAIGSYELLAILRDLTVGKNCSISEIAQSELKEHLKELVPLEAQDHAKKVLAEIKKRFPNEVAKVDEAWDVVQGETSKLSTDLNIWFEAVMNRTTDRFVFFTRIISIAFALALAVGLQLDSLEVLKNLSTDSELRAKLSQVVDAKLIQAQSQLLRKPIPVEALETIQIESDLLKAKEIPQDISIREQGVLWIQNAIGPVDNFTSLIEKYEKEYDELTHNRLTKLASEIQILRVDLEKSRLVVLPVDWEEYKNRWRNVGKHGLGILISVLLLSLGAPFWFNMLRTVATLRPVLAGTTDPSKGEKRKT